MTLISRLILAGMLAAGAAMMFVTPRTPIGPPEGNADVVIVDYWEKWTSKEAAQMQEIVADFNASVGHEKKIFVRYLSMSGISQKTLVATAGGVPPDIAGLFDGQLVQFASLDALEPLDALAAERGIGPHTYKPVYWKACTYKDRLWALVSTPAVTALHYNKRVMRQEASRLRAAGLDPDRPPRTIDELDRYASALETYGADGKLDRAGYLPLEPGWFLNHTALWFGGKVFDEANGRFTLTDPAVVRAYEWIQSYSIHLGRDAVTEFRSGLGQFSSAQNAFFVDKVILEQQGPWMANFIREYDPDMVDLLVPQSREQELADRRDNYAWAAAPFPSAVPGLEDVTYCGADMLVIPRGARHKREAFEFIAYVQRQDVMEKLNKLHCKNSPLARVSEDFMARHPNPYVAVFERLASSPNAHTVPQVPIWPEVNNELNVMTQRIYLLQDYPRKRVIDYLTETEQRLQKKYDDYLDRQSRRAAETASPDVQ